MLVKVAVDAGTLDVRWKYTPDRMSSLTHFNLGFVFGFVLAYMGFTLIPG